ncbi:MAG TPA: SBBP repeat-containing protein [Candidatus Sulfotelmatobacter sp.]|nr:SBBP repeat-containing protein [Candidatus Sulfotelmatobacter sp.]
MKTKLFTVGAVCIAVLAIVAVYNHGRQMVSRDSVAKKSNDSAVRLRALETYGKIPLIFEENSGQTDARVKFLARGAGYTVFLTDRDATLRLERPSVDPGPPAKAGAVVRFALAGANSHPVAHAVGLQLAHANYFVGNDPQKWRHGVAEYARVKFDAVYPGIDLVYYGSQGQLESDYVVSPGANPNRIALRVQGADRIRLDSDGDAILSTGAGDVSLHQPRAYQQSAVGRVEVAASYVSLASGALGIRVGAYDAKLPLIIDPVVGYATLLSGSTGATAGNAIAVDSAGNAYLVGTTGAADFPTTSGAFQKILNAPSSGNAFVTKFNSTGTALVFSTYLGGSGLGSGFDSATGVAVDASGNVYVAGVTPSTDFPVTAANAFQIVNNGTPRNGFLTKLDPTGATLLYSTYLGGSGIDSCAGIAVDVNQNAYLTGLASSTNFPVTATAIQTAGQSTGLAFVTRIDTTKSGTGSLIYSTLLGGTHSNEGTAIAVDSNFNAYITGQTSSSDFRVTSSAFQSTLKGTFGNAFVSRVDTTTANNLVYSTYLGGTATSGAGDSGAGIALDPNFNVYVTGDTNTSDFPVTTGVLQGLPKNTNQTTFVARLDMTKSNAASLIYSTYLGGSTLDAAAAIAVDGGGNAYLTGSTQSSDFPTMPGAPQFTRTTSNRNIAYVSVLNSTGTKLSFSTYFGGTSNDIGTGIALDSTTSPNVYITGATASTDFPITTGAFQATFKTAAAFAAKLSPAAATGVLLSPSPVDFGSHIVGVTSQPRVVTLANLTQSGLKNIKISFTGPNAADFLASSTCGGTIAVGATCTISIAFTPSITGTETATLSVSDSDASSPQTVPLTGTGTAPPSPVFLTPAPVNFGNQAIGSTSAAQTVTLKNTSTGAVNNIVVSITGANASLFAQTNACPAALAAGASCTISVTFAPTATGAVSATLSVADSFAGSPQTAALTGTGTTTTADFTLAVSPISTSVAAGSPANVTVTVVGLNSFANSVALTCSGTPAGSTCTLNPTSVTPTPTGATSTATIMTTARTTPATPSMTFRIGPRSKPGLWNASLGLVALGSAFVVWMVRRIGAMRKLAWTFAVLLTLSLTSCSGLPTTGTPAGTYMITFTGTSGTLTHSATVSLTVT